MIGAAEEGGDLTRQAIVLIHGMGEQEPGATLRQMADAILPDDRPNTVRYASRPDKMTNGPDARRLLSFEWPEKGRPQTEVYEYHWAHLMPGNKISHLGPLVKGVYLRSPGRLPRRMLPLWFLGWVLALGIAGLVAWLFMSGVLEEVTLAAVLAAVGVTGVVAWIVKQIFNLISGWVTSSFVDVARYVDPAPLNQEARDAIRKGAVDLLSDLHESGRYGRIVVVAHSLGSFIGYEAIHYLWARMNQAHNSATLVDTQLRKYERAAAVVVDGPSGVAAEGAVAEYRRRAEEYRRLQRELWQERRRSGSPWLITDFVSVGSPMAFAAVLLAKDREELRQLQRVTELPTNPPEPELRPNDGGGGINRSYSVSWLSKPIIYHGAPFSVVRWTNVWFSTDWFSGPLGEVFGHGIEDHRAALHGVGQRIPLVSHSHYFKRNDDEQVANEPGGSVDLLRKAVSLDAAGWIPDVELVPRPDTKVWPPVDPVIQWLLEHFDGRTAEELSPVGSVDPTRSRQRR